MLRNSLETGYGLKTHRDGDRFVVDSIDVPPVPDPPAPRPLAAWEPVSEPVSDREYGLFLGRAWVDGADRYWQLWVTLRGCTDVADAAAVAGSTDAGPLPRLSSIGDIVRYAHDLQSHEIVWPAGVEDVAIDVVSSSGQRTGVVNHSQCQTFLRQALANEVDLQAHFETGSSDLWYLRVDEGGTNLNLARTGTIERATGERVDRHVWSRPNAIYGSAASMPRLAAYLSNRLRTPVIDETGLTQLYDFSFVWQPAPADSTDPEQVEFEAMRAAMLRWWGLVLVPGEAELRRFIVDNVEFPELPDELPRTF
jgi:uncharacterized protein (TIGR03435 family)